MVINVLVMWLVNLCFFFGFCVKIFIFLLDKFVDVFLGWLYCVVVGKDKLKVVIENICDILGIFVDYKIGIVFVFDIGVVEMVMWLLLGECFVEMVVWELFGVGWVSDVVKQLKIEVNVYIVEYGEIVDFDKVNFDNDVVFIWNGIILGVCVLNGDFILVDCVGLIICDVILVVFVQDLVWDKLDVVIFFWQKVMGGEVVYGMLILLLCVVECLESYILVWLLLKIFCLIKGGKLIDGIFIGVIINMFLMLVVEDYLVVLDWVKEIGGLQVLFVCVDVNV